MGKDTTNKNYVIIEQSENPLEAVIERRNLTTKFTLGELLSDAKRAEKVLQETKAQLELDSAARTNIEQNHPFVKEATPEEVEKAHHITLYKEYDKKCKESEQRIKQIESIFEEHEKELKNIKEDTGIEVPKDNE